LAIAFAHMRVLSRSNGGNAVRTSAYNRRADMLNERTGERFYFSDRDDPQHHEILLPDGASEAFRDAAVLWNAAEKAEKRKDSQVAREVLLALPANLEISDEDRLELTRSFVQEHFVSKGVAAQIDIHAPHGEDAESETANWHAHVLVTLRRIEGDRFATKKALDLNPQFGRFGAKRYVNDGWPISTTWRDHQNAFFRASGYEVRVDATAPTRGEHLGPVRMRRWYSDANQRAAEREDVNQQLARDPDVILEALTRNSATFSEKDLFRYLDKHGGSAAERVSLAKAVLQHGDVLSLHDRSDGQEVGRYTTTKVRREEQRTMKQGAAVAAQMGNGVAVEIAQAVAGGMTMREDQLSAFAYATQEGGLKIIEGRAGTGKSYTLEAVRKAHARAGYRVMGLAPTNAVAQDLKANGLTEAKTIHSALFALKNGRDSWNRKLVLVVDEAAMVDTKMLGELLSEAHKAHAKVVLAGDDRQLASIERGGLFTELRRIHGSAEITEVTRQRGWQKQAARDLAEGRFERAVAAFDGHGAITWTADQAEAHAALVEAWATDVAADPSATRFVFAYTNADVDTLNTALRAVRRERGELGADVRLPTRRGMMDFAVGDRVQFTDTDRKVGVSNGQAGQITRIDRRTQDVTVRLDAAGGKPGKVVTWSASQFGGFRHGYAGTIYKGQGKTLDHSYLYHTHHWRSAASYVALTRQRETAKVFVAHETAKDTRQLARQLSRGDFKMASLAFATAAEVRPERRSPAQNRAADTVVSNHRASQKARREEGRWQLARTETPTTPKPQVTQPKPDLEQATASSEPSEARASQDRRTRVAAGGYRALGLPTDQVALRAALNAYTDATLDCLVRAAVTPVDSAVHRATDMAAGDRLTRIDVACEIDATFAAAFRYAERMRENVVKAKGQLLRTEEGIDLVESRVNQLREQAGLFRRVMHGLNIGRNESLDRSEARLFELRDQHTQQREQLDKVTPELVDAERAEKQAYDRIAGDVEAEWTTRNRLHDMARQIILDRADERFEQEWQQEQRERAHERQRSRERGIELGRDFGPDL
jgi:Ti-type conjugative transfer relaxase TraA